MKHKNNPLIFLNNLAIYLKKKKKKEPTNFNNTGRFKKYNNGSAYFLKKCDINV